MSEQRVFKHSKNGFYLKTAKKVSILFPQLYISNKMHLYNF